MKIHEIRAKISQIETVMRELYDTAAAESRDLEGEALERWNASDAELKELKAKLERAETRDSLDRNSEGRTLETRGNDEGVAWCLPPEQRMSAFVARQANQPEQRVSLGRALGAMLKGDWRDAELERRAMGESSGGAGGFLVPTPISASILDLARNASVMVRAGAGTVPMTSNNLTLVKVVSDPTAQWRGEGQEITE